MSGRSAKVSSLSDKIQGLKFMQRAASSSTSTQQTQDDGAGASAAAAAEATKGNQKDATGNEEDAENEQWTLHVPNKSSNHQPKRVESRIVAEPGWNQWLGRLLEEGRDNSKTGEQNRMMFGAWAESAKKRKTLQSEEEDDGAIVRTDESDSSNDEPAPVKQSANKKGFLKPGSISKKTDLGKAEKGKGSPGRQQTGKNAKRRKS